jgi:hypothetical protein
LAIEFFVWEDRRPARQPRAVVQRGRCDENQCGQFPSSISNGERGMTLLTQEQKFRDFLERGAAEQP